MNTNGDRELITRYLQDHPPVKGYITRREVARNCADCLNAKGNSASGT